MTRQKRGKKDKAVAGTKMQQKRVFNEHSYFSYPRLKAQTASGFLQREREEHAVVLTSGLGTTPGRAHPTSSSPRHSPSCPPQPQYSANPSAWLCLQTWPSLKTLSKANLCLERLFRFLLQLMKGLSAFSSRTLTESALNCSHCRGNCLPLPGPQRHSLLSEGVGSWLCSYTPTTLTSSLRSRQSCWSRSDCLPHFHCIFIWYPIWKKYDGASFANLFPGRILP